jgi:7,8-dihydroneopterin aldolase/epimerase/oxygenase
MDRITISDLEVYCRVGVSEDERSAPQRLLFTVDLFLDLGAAAATDDLRRTIDYYAVSRRLLDLGQAGEWRLIERLASDIAGLVLGEFAAERVRVEVKKFVLPEARWVAVELVRGKAHELA